MFELISYVGYKISDTEVQHIRNDGAFLLITFKYIPNWLGGIMGGAPKVVQFLGESLNWYIIPEFTPINGKSLKKKLSRIWEKEVSRARNLSKRVLYPGQDHRTFS